MGDKVNYSMDEKHETIVVDKLELLRSTKEKDRI